MTKKKIINVEDVKYIKGTTESGFRFKIDPEVFRDLEIIDLINEVDEGNPLGLPKLLEKILGQRQKDNLYKFCKAKDGFVDVETVSKILAEIFKAGNVKNS